MIGPLLDELSVKAGERYVNFLMSLRGVLASTRSTPPKDTRAFSAIRTGSYEVARVYMDTEIEFLDRDLNRLQEHARALVRTEVLSGPPSSTYALSDYSEEIVTWFRQELRSQIERDINSAVQKRREIILDATITSRTKGVPLLEAYELALTRREGVNFYFTDRSGRRYPSQKFIRQLFRHTLLTAAVETFALEAASYGVTELEITHPDKNHSFNGELITLVETPNVLTLADVRDDVFHPNSNAFLRTAT